MQTKLLCLLIVSLFMMCLPTFSPLAPASAATEPDDDVNGTYAQVIDGDWAVSKSTSLSDEVVIMNGNIDIQDGATLTLTNTTIIFNVTSDGQYELSVSAGATLKLFDRDNDPNTEEDGSLITDTTHDTDGGGSSDRYYNLYFERKSRLYLHNSVVEEFTKKGGDNEVSLDSEVVLFNGTTFRDAGNFFYMGRSSTTQPIIINNCDFRDGQKFLDVSSYSMSSSLSITNCTFENSEYPITMRYANEVALKNDTFLNCSGLTLEYSGGIHIEDCNFSDLEGYDGISIYSSSDCLLKDLSVKDSYSGIHFGYCQDVTLENVTVYNTTENNLDLFNQNSFVVMRNSSLMGSPGNNINLNNAKLYCYNTQIGKTGDWMNAYVSYSTAYFDRARTTGQNGVFVEHGQAWLANSTVSATNMEQNVGKESQTTLINTTLNFSKTYTFPGWDYASRGNLRIGYYLQTNVTDTAGVVYGALVTAKDKFGDTAAQGVTNQYGRTLFALINRTHYYDSMPQVDYYGPYTVSSLIQGNFKAASKSPKMDRNEYVNIAYLINTPPSRPSNVKAAVQGTSINISWEHFCPDYGHFRIYKNNTAGGFDFGKPFYNSSGKPDQAKRFFVDVNAAVNHSTYRYIVKIVDTIGQEGQNTEAVQNGDWVVSGLLGPQAVSDLDLRVNGTIYIIDGGQLTLTNVSLSFDNPGGTAVQVISGLLRTQDRDLDPATAGDNCELKSFRIVTNISSISTTRLVIAADAGGRLELKNTVVSDLGVAWAQSPYSESNGIYLASDGNVIDGCTFVDAAVPVTGADLSGLRISNCTVKGSHEFAFRVLRSTDVRLCNNTVWGASQNAVYMEHADRVSLIGNRLNSTKGHGVRLSDCNNVVISENEISKGKPSTYMIYAAQSSDYFIYDNYLHEGFSSTGLYLSEIINYSVHDNRLANLSRGLYTNTYEKDLMLKSTPLPNYVFNNTVTGCADFGLMVSATVGGEVYRNLVNDCQTGIRVAEVKGLVLKSNTVTDCAYGLAVEAGVGGRTTLYNETYRNTKDVTLAEMVSVDAVNCVMNRSSLEIEAFCTLTTKWFVNVTVKDCFGATLQGANLKVKTLFGTPTSNTTTGAGGRCEWLVVTQNLQKSNGNFTQTPTTFEARYGNHTGTLSAAVTGPCELVVNLTNALPEVLGLHLLPVEPTTQDNISASYAYQDPEGDLESGTHYLWYRNGELYPAATGSPVLDANHTKKGEVWFLSVAPSDAIGLGLPYNSTSVLIKNSPPSVSGIKLYPTDPDTSMVLYCNYTYNDADSDPEGGTMFRWYCKNATASDFEYRSTTFSPNLSAGNTNKNDLWRCGIIPHDGEGWGTEALSASVHTNNTPPVITDVEVSPSEPDSDQDLTISYVYYDTDQDPESGTAYDWYVDRGAGEVAAYHQRTLPKALTLKGDIWRCCITPSDGQSNGTPVYGPSVSIGNTAPTISGLAITPASPRTDQNLSVAYVFWDADLDPENGTVYEWERKDPATQEFKKLGVSSRTLKAYQVAKGDVIRCRVQPNDGSQEFGQEAVSPEVVIMNSPPRLSGVALPQAPTKAQDLAVAYVYSDPDGDTLSGMKVRWSLDGTPAAQYDDSPSVPASALSKGQAWTCTLQVSDGANWSAWSACPQVTVRNAPPSASNLGFDYPANSIGMPLSTDDVTAHFDYEDKDQDPLNATTVRWYQNGRHFPQMDQEMTLLAAYTNKTDVWNFTLQVSDGQDLSAEYRSPLLSIGNAGPVIQAPHPQNLSVSLYEGETLEFWVDVFEPDSDPLAYRWYLKGESVWNLESYTLKPDFLSAGTYILNVSISDSDERRTYEVYWEWQVEVKDLNRAPQITEFLPDGDLGKVEDVVMFKIDYSDADEDNQLQVVWYFDDQVVQRGKGTFTFYPSEGTPGKHTLRAVVSDGQTSAEHSWNLTIPPSEKASGPLNITWDKWGFFVQILVISISALLGLFGIYKLRRRQGVISNYLEKMKKLYEDNRSTPDAGLREIKKVYEEVLRLYEKRRISDSHFLVLERNYDNYVGLFRKYIIMDIDNLKAPAALKGQIQSILKDGKVTEKELTMFKKSVLSSDMSKAKKMNLIAIMQSWAHHDKKIIERSQNIREKMEAPPPIPTVEEVYTEDVDLTVEEEAQIAELFGTKSTAGAGAPKDAVPPPPSAEEKPFEDEEGILDDEEVDLTPGKRIGKRKDAPAPPKDDPMMDMDDWDLEDEEDEFEGGQFKVERGRDEQGGEEEEFEEGDDDEEEFEVGDGAEDGDEADEKLEADTDDSEAAEEGDDTQGQKEEEVGLGLFDLDKYKPDDDEDELGGEDDE